jgi:DNA-binding PucR family transcriptional regulator
MTGKATTDWSRSLGSTHWRGRRAPDTCLLISSIADRQSAYRTHKDARLREARRARALGSLLEPQGQVHKYDELRLLDLFKQDATTDSFVQEVLAPLLGRDKRSRAHIVETLDAFFAAGMVRKAAATQLRIHPNSLDYRLKMIEVTLGYRVRGNSAFTLQLALKLLPLTRAEALRTPRDHGPELG